MEEEEGGNGFLLISRDIVPLCVDHFCIMMGHRRKKEFLDGIDTLVCKQQSKNAYIFQVTVEY